MHKSDYFLEKSNLFKQLLLLQAIIINDFF